MPTRVTYLDEGALTGTGTEGDTVVSVKMMVAGPGRRRDMRTSTSSIHISICSDNHHQTAAELSLTVAATATITTTTTATKIATSSKHHENPHAGPMPCLKFLGIQKGNIDKQTSNPQREKHHEHAVPTYVGAKSYLYIYSQIFTFLALFRFLF